jgi:hypothetical protein
VKGEWDNKQCEPGLKMHDLLIDLCRSVNQIKMFSRQ